MKLFAGRGVDVFTGSLVYAGDSALNRVQLRRYPPVRPWSGEHIFFMVPPGFVRDARHMANDDRGENVMTVLSSSPSLPPKR